MIKITILFLLKFFTMSAQATAKITETNGNKINRCGPFKFDRVNGDCSKIAKNRTIIKDVFAFEKLILLNMMENPSQSKAPKNKKGYK